MAVLKNELRALDLLLSDLITRFKGEDLTGTEVAHLESELEPVLTATKARWSQALFSARGAGVLTRYFSFHLDALAQMINKNSPSPVPPRSANLAGLIAEKLLELLMHLRELYGPYLNDRSTAPALYLRWWQEQYEPVYARIKEAISHFNKEPLGGLLDDYLNAFFHAPADLPFSYHSLDYAGQLMGRLTAHLSSQQWFTPAQVEQILSALNFNQLDYFLYLQQKLKAQLTALPDNAQTEQLRAQLFRWSAYTATLIVCYPDWPSLSVLMTGWIKEEALLVEQRQQALHQAENQPHAKLPLNLPVSYIALILSYLPKISSTRRPQGRSCSVLFPRTFPLSGRGRSPTPA
jgi:primosomal protein N''